MMMPVTRFRTKPDMTINYSIQSSLTDQWECSHMRLRSSALESLRRQRSGGYANFSSQCETFQVNLPITFASGRMNGSFRATTSRNTDGMSDCPRTDSIVSNRFATGLSRATARIPETARTAHNGTYARLIRPCVLLVMVVVGACASGALGMRENLAVARGM